MSGFLKGLVKGILYFLFFPFGLLAIALYAVVGVFVFIFQFFKLIFLFFTGRNLQSDLPEDIALKKILEKESPLEKEEEQSPLSLYPSDSIVYGSGYSSPLIKEEEKEDTPNEESEVEKEEEDNDAY